MDKKHTPTVKKKIKPLYIILGIIVALPVLYFGIRQTVSVSCDSGARKYVRDGIAKYPRTSTSEAALAYEFQYTLCMRKKGFNP